ncbi:MAG: glycosyltransferase family 4 protein [Thermoleophilia bacterium]
MTPLRAAFVNHYTGYGGAELMLLTLFERIDRRRVTPVLLVPGEGLLPDRARELGVETHVVPVSDALLDVTRGGAGSRGGAARAAAALPGAVTRLARAIRRVGADVVVTNSAKAHVYGSLAGRLARRPVVWRIHDTMDSPDFGGATRGLLLRIGARIPRRILSVSDSTARPLIEGGIPRERVVTLYNGIDLSGLREAAAAADAAPQGPPRVGSVGRLTPLKGHDVVLEAAQRLVRRGVDARFVIAGAAAREAPGHLDELRAQAERLGIAERVELISPFDDLGSLLAGLDVFVHASVLPDSLPTTVIESMAVGRPVVATDLGGAPELVREGETGLLIPPGDPDRMADAVQQLLAAPERRAEVGRAASAEATARFDVRAFADAFAAHVEDAAAHRRGV